MKLCRSALVIVGHVEGHVVESCNLVFAVILSTNLVEIDKGIHQCVAVLGIGGILGNDPSDQSGSVNEHGLVGGRRAKLVSLSPVRESGVIVLALEILFVVREILDALGTVCAVFSLSEDIVSSEHQNNRCYRDKCNSSHDILKFNYS